MAKQYLENNEARALSDLIEFSDKHILEISCGDGRLTWFYADQPVHIIAIDPSVEQIALAKNSLPDHLQPRIDFQVATLEDFAAESAASIFDMLILSYSLC